MNHLYFFNPKRFQPKSGVSGHSIAVTRFLVGKWVVCRRAHALLVNRSKPIKSDWMPCVKRALQGCMLSDFSPEIRMSRSCLFLHLKVRPGFCFSSVISVNIERWLYLGQKTATNTLAPKARANYDRRSPIRWSCNAVSLNQFFWIKIFFAYHSPRTPSLSDGESSL